MFKHKEKGQSVIELTFFLIILLILIAGIVEVGAILQTKLTVVNSAREGARFGTLSASDDDVTLVTQAAAANIINYDNDSSDIWVIRAKTHEDTGAIGTGCPNAAERATAETYWCVEHTVGTGPETPEFVTKDDIEDTLEGVNGTEVVGVAVSYDHQSIIGLPYAVGGGGMPVTSFTVMRVESTGDAALGCQVWPIGIDWDSVKDLNKGDELVDALEGGDSGNFGWLSWNGDVNATTLGDSMANPMQGSCVAVEGGDPICYTNGEDAEDHDLSVGDWVQNAVGWKTSNAINDAIDAHRERYIRIVVWEQAQARGGSGTEEDPYTFTGSCTGNNCYYRVKGYAIIQITDVVGNSNVLNSSDKTLEARFIRFDTSCN
jgi:Flp pilus assembly protein TadG